MMRTLLPTNLAHANKSGQRIAWSPPYINHDGQDYPYG
jgi:hypothetical protein